MTKEHAGAYASSQKKPTKGDIVEINRSFVTESIYREVPVKDVKSELSTLNAMGQFEHPLRASLDANSVA